MVGIPFLAYSNAKIRATILQYNVGMLHRWPFAPAILTWAVFTIGITWRVKSLELTAAQGESRLSIVGQEAPDFHLVDLDGREVALSRYRGRKVVVIFWASWCGPCRSELPEMARFYRSSHKADSAFELLAISIDDDKSAAESAAKHDKLPFPVLLDANRTAADAYRVDVIPVWLVVDEKGKISGGASGFRPGTAASIADALGIKAPATEHKEAADEPSH